MKVHTFLSILLLIFSALYILPGNASAVAINMHIEGPSVAATESNVTYKISLEGFFDYYKCTMLISGKNLTGAKPVTQVIQQNSKGVFIFTLTTPKVPQRLYISFSGFGILNSTNETSWIDRKVVLDVKEPKVITVKIKNPQTYEVTNVNLTFYVDGKYIGYVVVDKISPNSTKTVEYRWVPAGLSDGVHTLKVKIASDGVVFENGETVYTYDFYYGTPPNYDYFYYASVAILIALIFLVALIILGKVGRRSSVKKPKWKS